LCARGAPVAGVIVDPNRIQVFGRVSAVIDADVDGLDDLTARRLVLEHAGDLAAVHAIAKRFGKREFARRTGPPSTVAERAVRGAPISKRNFE